MHSSLLEDISDIRAKAIARQESDMVGESMSELLDTQSSIEGNDGYECGYGYRCSLEQIAQEIGASENKYPRQNAKQFLSRVQKKFTLHYCIYLASKAAKAIGFNEKESMQFAVDSITLQIKNGDRMEEILRGWINGKD